MADTAFNAGAAGPIIRPSTWLSVIIGLGMGVMPATSEMVPIAFLLLSLICFWLEPGPIIRQNHALVWPLLAYLVVQLVMNIYHGSVEAGDGYARGYAQQILITLLILRLFSLQRIDETAMVYSTALASFLPILIVTLQRYAPAEGLHCRAEAYSGNVQWLAAFQVLVVAAVLIFWHKRRLRFGLLAYGLVAATLVSIGALSGARMALYTFLAFLGLYPIYLARQARWAPAAKTWGAATAGLVLTFAIDIPSGCGFSQRVADQFRFAPEMMQFFGQSDPVLDQFLGKTPEASDGAKPIPILLLPVQMVQTQVRALAGWRQQGDGMDLHLAQSTADQGQTPKPEHPQADNFVNPDDASAIAHAGGLRVQTWKNAMAAIRLAPILGHGQAAEASFVVNGYQTLAGLTHFHNQYLSWMAWSGAIGLASGLCFIAAMALRGADPVLGWTFLGVLGLLFLTETFLFAFNLHVLIVIYAFYLRLSRPAPQP